ncbi:MAG: diguanylate cyclase [Deltaproteobacteria bacterium]|nr:diguanylate cyclase [Candidatus Tharpella aukensis]
MAALETDLLTAIAAGTGCGLVILDKDGLVEYWSPQLEGVCGLVADRIIGLPWSELVLPPTFSDTEGMDGSGFSLVDAETALPELVFYPESGDLDMVGRRVGVLRLPSNFENECNGYPFVGETAAGIPSSRAMFDLLQRQLAYMNRYQTPFALLFLRMKNYPPISEILGSENWDITSRAVYDQLKVVVRMADSVGLYNEDTFWMVLANSDIEGTMVVAEKIKHLAGSMKIDIADVFLSVAVGGVIAREGENCEALAARGLAETGKALDLPVGISVGS